MMTVFRFHVTNFYALQNNQASDPNK